VVLLLSLPLLAQRPAPEERGGGGGGAADRGMSAGTGGGATSRGISTGSFSTPSAPAGRPEGGNFGGPSYSGGGGGAAYVPTPNLAHSSFSSANSYWAWQGFLSQLQLRYMSSYMSYYMLNSYMTRFTRNQEPLITPQLMKLALREPLTVSGRLVRAVEDLETMVADRQAGKAVSKDAIADKAHEIRDLAKRIRQDQSLSYVDQRIDRDGKLDATDQLGLEAVAELKQLANDLHTQLKGMFTQSSTATVSVRNLSQPSFEALSKKIEKLSKVVEGAAKRS
jgi:hypothetical protein